MKAFRIQNDIVAARTEHEAIAAWAEEFEKPFNSAGPVEEVDPKTLVIEMPVNPGEPDGDWREGLLEEIMPVDGPASVVCGGECEDCT